MKNYEELVHTIIDPIILKPEAVLIRQSVSENNKDLTLLIVAESEDTARLIGKRGVVANAIRDLINVAGKVDKVRIHLKFESFDQEGSEKE